MGKTTELLTLLKTGNSDAARKLITKLKKSGEEWLAELRPYSWREGEFQSPSPKMNNC